MGCWDEVPPAGDPSLSNRVLFGDIDPASGEVVTWTESISGNLSVPIWGHGGVLANNGNMFVLGGRGGSLESPEVSSTVKSALVDDEDPARIYNWCGFEPCERWVGQVGEYLLAPRAGAASVAFQQHIYVIGGVEEEDPLDTVLRGGIGGIGGERRHFYAPRGSYRSSEIDLDDPYQQSRNQVKGLAWRAYISETAGMSLTMQYRYRNVGSAYGDWGMAWPSQVSDDGGGYRIYTATIGSSETATRFFQYQANMSTMSNTVTPRLDWVRVYFDVPDPDVRVSKSGRDSVYPKETISYTIHYTAVGGIPAPNVVLTETVPGNTIYTGSSGWVLVNGDVYTYSLGTKGTTGSGIQHGSVNYQVTVDEDLPEGERFITNVVRIDFPPMTDYWGNVISDPVRGDNVFTDVIPLFIASWDIDKTAEPYPQVEILGERPVVTYTIRYTFTGNVTETGSVWITDVVDINYLEIITYSDPGKFDRTNNTLEWKKNAGTIGPGQGEAVTFTVWVTRPLENGTQFANQASIGSARSLERTTPALVHTVVSTPTLSISKSASPPSGTAIRPDSIIAYTVTVTNTGGMNVTSAVISDTLDSEYLSVLSYSEGGALVGSDTITWTADVIPVDTQWVVSFTAQVTNVSEITLSNQAEVSSAQVPVVRSNVVTHAVPLITASWDVDKTAEPYPQVEILGERPVITYTIRYTFTGNVTDTGPLLITDVVDIDYLEIITYSDAGQVKRTGNTLVWTKDAETIGPEQGEAVTFTVWVTRPLDNGTQFVNRAAVESQRSTTETSEPLTHTVVSTPTLSILKSASPPSGSEVWAHSSIAYTVTVTNTGGMNATSAVITDTFDSDHLSLLSYSEGGALVNSDTITWTGALLPVDTPWVVTFTADVSDVHGVTITNQAEVDSTQRPAVQSNDVTHFVPSFAILNIEKDDLQTEVEVGEVLTYHIAFTNTGSAPATGVRITDTFPASVVEPYGPNVGWEACGAGCRYYDFAGTLSDAPQTITFTVQVSQSAQLGPFTNHVSIGGEDETIPDTGTDVDTVISQWNVTISKSDGRTTVYSGGYLTYTIDVVNADSVGYSVVLTEALPAEVRYVGYGWYPVGSNTYTRSLTVSAGGSETLPVFVQVGAGTAEGTVLTNTVTMFGGRYVSFPGGGQATDATTVNLLSDLTVYKSNGVGGVNPGQRITYTIVYTNNGNVAIPGVKITETLPSGLTFVPVGSTCEFTGSHPLFVADIGSVSPGQVAQCTLVATVDGGTSGFIDNVVRIRGTEDEDNWANNEFTDTDYVAGGPFADLYQVTISPVTPTVGSGANFVVTVYNRGGKAQDLTGLAEDEVLLGSFRLPPPPPGGGGDMGSQAVDCSRYEDYIYVGLYVDPYREPMGPADDWRDYDGYIELPIPAGESRPLVDTWYTGEGATGYGRLSHIFGAPGWHHIAAQVDVYFDAFDQCGWSPTFGHIPETDETNNLGTLDIWVEAGSSVDGGVYLPIIMKNSS